MLWLHLLCVKKYMYKFLTKLVPTRSLSWIAFFDLSLEGNTDIGFGGVYHLWIFHKIYGLGGVISPQLRADRSVYHIL